MPSPDISAASNTIICLVTVSGSLVKEQACCTNHNNIISFNFFNIFVYKRKTEISVLPAKPNRNKYEILALQ